MIRRWPWLRRCARIIHSVPVKIVISGEPTEANAKICSTQKMYAVARYDYLIMSDSDVQVKSNYIREVVAELLNPEVGMVTCMYRGATSGGLLVASGSTGHERGDDRRAYWSRTCWKECNSH